MRSTDYELLPTPRGTVGQALRITSPIIDELCACSSEQELAELLAQRRTGLRRVVDGVAMVPVTIACWAPGQRSILCHLNGFTDNHRDDFRPSLLEPLPGSPVHAAAFLLPCDGVLSYRLAEVGDLDPHIGSRRPGWREVHLRGRPDPTMPLRIPTPLGGEATVWYGPDCGVETWPSQEREIWHPVTVAGRQVRVLPGDERVVVLLDGQFWRSLSCGSGMRAAGLGHTLVQVPSEMKSREAEMTETGRAASLVECGLKAASRVLAKRVQRAHAVAGQSFGGLAVAGVAADRPDLLGVGIVQSGSLWYPDPEQEHGQLVQRLLAGEAMVDTPIIIHVGSEEVMMVRHARGYRDALLARGARVTYCEVRGGHDYAWWRHGLVRALTGHQPPRSGPGAEGPSAESVGA